MCVPPTSQGRIHGSLAQTLGWEAVGMDTWLTYTRDVIRTPLWPIPTLAVVCALLLGLGLQSSTHRSMPTCPLG